MNSGAGVVAEDFAGGEPDVAFHAAAAEGADGTAVLADEEHGAGFLGGGAFGANYRGQYAGVSRVQLVDRFLNYIAHAVTCLLLVCLRRIGLIAGGGAGIIAGAAAYGGDYDYTLKTGRDERRARRGREHSTWRRQWQGSAGIVYYGGRGRRGPRAAWRCGFYDTDFTGGVDDGNQQAARYQARVCGRGESGGRGGHYGAVDDEDGYAGCARHGAADSRA